jgi:hypothetical protein
LPFQAQTVGSSAAQLARRLSRREAGIGQKQGVGVVFASSGLDETSREALLCRLR